MVADANNDGIKADRSQPGYYDDPENFRDYFYRLDEHIRSPYPDISDSELFNTNWGNLEEKSEDSSPKQHANTLINTVQKLNALPKKTQKREDKRLKYKCFRFAADNFQCWEKPALEKILKFNAIELTLVLWACSKLNVEPTKDFMRLWEARAIEIMEQRRSGADRTNFNAGQLAACLSAYANLGMSPSKAFLKALKKRSKPALEELDVAREQRPGYLINAYWSCAVLNFLKASRPLKAMAKDIYKVLKKKKDTLELSDARKRQFAFARLKFAGKHEEELPKEKSSPSHDEKKFRAICKRSPSIKVLKPYHIPMMGHDFDNTVMIDGQEIDIENDGWSHFTLVFNEQNDCYDRKLNGKTKFRNSLEEQTEPTRKILCVPFYVQQQIDEEEAEPEKQEKMVEGLLRQVSQQKKPGIFMATPGPELSIERL